MELKTDGTSFQLSYRGRTLVTHDNKNPCLFLGVGTAEYRMKFSHFKIRDNVREKRPLADFEVSGSDGKRVEIIFGGRLTMVLEDSEERLAISFKLTDGDENRFWLVLAGEKDEHLYGCGEQYTHLDLKGKKVPLFVQEQGVGRGKDLITLLADWKAGAGGAWHTTYFNQPTFVSSRNYYCHFENGSYAEFDFSHPDRHVLHFWEVPARAYIGVHGSAVETIGALTELLGRQPKLPAWVYNGVWLGVQGGSEVVDRKLRDALNAGVKVAALWCQDWEGIRMTSFGKRLMWNWQCDAKLYPGLDEKIAELKERGIRFLGYINPYLAVEGALYREASDRGFLVRRSDGAVYNEDFGEFLAGMVDFTDPEAFAWYKGVIKKEMLDLGLSGWMADFGEALPPDAMLHSRESGEILHNRYPALWARVNFEAVKEAGKSADTVYFMRSGYTGSSRYASVVWAGDQLVNWSLDDGLATVIPAGISLGFCGIGYFHSDTGGYTTVGWIKRSKELFMRWAEHSAFTQVMRTHEGNRPDSNWQFNSDEATLSHFARMSRIYASLRDYHLHLSEEYLATGLAPMRHPYVHFEGDPVLHSLKYQYLYGRDLMVAPVYRKGARSMKAYLPDDLWIHLWSGRAFSKGWHTVEAPLGKPPVFYRNGSNFSVLFQKIKDM